MRRFLSFLFLSAALAVPASGSASAQATTQSTTTAPDVRDIIFKEAERVLIEDFFGKKAKDADEDEEDKDDDDGKGKKHKDKGAKGKDKGLPPGLAKKKQLPPGLARQLERKGTLPPGLAKRDLPEDLENRLPPPPEGTERVIVDSDVVLIEQATGTILDILADVVTEAATGK